MKLKIALHLLFCGIVQLCMSQNLPSLVTDRNINSTFSIIAYDKATQEWGIAVATNNIYVGSSTIYIEPGLGAFSVIAETKPLYAINGFKQLQHGKTIEQAIVSTASTDSLADYRQVAGIDGKGHVYAMTGSSLKYWKGKAGHLTGESFVVMGNQLADNVLTSMAETFRTSQGTLAERLLQSLIAGQKAGGQINGKQSAALVVKGEKNEWFNQIDLRVDHSVQPFEDLQKLLNYHYGRIRLNQAMFAIRMKNIARGKLLLSQAEPMIEGWNGMYGKLAKAYLLLNDEKKAISIISKAIKENPYWKENLPAFYCLRHAPEIKLLLDETTFTLADWNNAISILIDLQKSAESIDLGQKILKQYPESSYTNYLLAKAVLLNQNKSSAKSYLEKAIQLDKANADAQRLLTQLKGAS
ncbi:DUF1028 domain-containing protein [Xanthocytophaga agilis]|uniref:DUF1028 domain-containing protein n=1 Tax=Xanthocytophaga agilis TaxID=3048010 RepID=A0AAE3UJ39_9BACT|nr:DUF1028 domain-containing protein [Xanthocytophaga agilis]MDJ1505367.1 DUF1028 domain-containing protein [Xanthocytophaga agilis]